MALLFIDSFDHYDPAINSEVAMKWDNTPNQSYLDSATGRFGGKAARLEYYSSFFQKNFSGNPQTVILGTAWRGVGSITGNSANGTFVFGNGDGSHQCSIRPLSDGSVTASRGGSVVLGTSAPGIIIQNTWHYIEVRAKASNSDGEVEIKVDGEIVLNISGEDTLLTGSTESWSLFRILGDSSSSTANYFLFDDLYLLDLSGSKNNDFLGDCRVDTFHPNASGEATVLTPAGGSENFECVSGELYSTASHVQGNTGIDTYAFPPCGISGEIFGIQPVYGSGRTEPITSMKSTNIVRVSSTNYSGEEHTETDSPSFKTDIFETDPSDDGDWTATKIDASEFGVKLI
jgi:hypothetical protein